MMSAHRSAAKDLSPEETDLGPKGPSVEETHFGFSTVPLGDKQDLVDDVFHKVARRYDIMNDVMSMGVHRLWKDALVTKLRPSQSRSLKLLDVAGGTGDIAFRVLDAGTPRSTATVFDINAHMLDVGRDRCPPCFADRIDFVQGNAESLPFESNSFDAYTIAFGIRNVPRIDLALQEAFRVLRRGGRLLVLEFSKVHIAGLDKIYDSYSFHVVPKMGQVIAGDAAPYQYLVESIRKFPAPDDFATLIGDAGFRRVDYTPMSGGIVALHSGWKL
jgi:demethylmenaquinone methyltransferase / 2-methoxy-6-polyprenyl-1,4-benzoquinol methylase